MELFDMSIREIHSETMVGDRIVKVDLTYDFYGGPYRETMGFFKEEWKHYKHQMNYPENRALTLDSIEHFASMSDDEWYRFNYTTNISRFSDQEIVDEFNRRLNSCMHHISLDTKAVITTGR